MIHKSHVKKIALLLLILPYSSDCTDSNPQAKKAIIIGASSGMGREVAKMLAADGYTIGLTSRKLPLLKTLQQEIPTQTYIQEIDASIPGQAVQKLNELILKMGGVDLLIITASGVKDANQTSRDWKADKSILNVDVIGFSALARTALNYFEKQGHGHLVGFSSIDGIRGIAACPAYSAAKAFCSRYLEAERNRCKQNNIPITITDIIPGWINSQGKTDYSHIPNAYWVENLADASQEIFDAIKNKDEVAYITKRWQQVADLLKVIPDDLYNALSARPGGSF